MSHPTTAEMDEASKKCVYMLKSPSNKVYVGKTINVANRFKQHKYASTRTEGYAIFHALKKYGWDNFTKTILETFEDDVTNKQMSDRETYWIKEKKAFGPNGYNLTEGGEGSFGRVVSAETRAKMGKASIGNTWTKGIRHSAEARANMKKAQRQRIDNMSKEERVELSKKLSEQTSDTKVPVIATEKKTGVKRKFESVHEATRGLTKEFGIQFNRAHISNCANKRPNYNSHRGWKFEKAK